MKLSKFTDYALRTALYLAAHEDRLVSISEISAAHGIPQSSVMKVVNQLVDGGFLSSTRGRLGGVRLSRPASEQRVGDIARYMEGDTPMVDCSSCLLRGSCGLVRGLYEAQNAYYDSLNRFTVAEAVRADPRTMGILLGAAAKKGESGLEA
ncbi:Rrf2 family transcriptional regulator [Rhodobacter sp. NTK016B]|uniref:RrF2 family transcriptional regulator n=1 Tax=Rhodobacter sp. NTK016B TaxID=2759676 RepID=UPI001A8C5D92|nr:Rrf2 family transcriptional regulator [Rhodobacter sp. NTK016B]MBN8293062.1 Rrf2 family transcriptional regulator [Rhodobacter sp. NTK016B]